MSLPHEKLLEVNELHTYYGKSHILQGVNLHVHKNEVLSLLGRNGSGRSTTLKSIMGLVAPHSGSVLLNGCDVAGWRPYQICRSGLAYVPEERQVFANLTVEENLHMGEQAAVEGAPEWTVAQMFDYFPRLKERRNTRAGSISGGEQQMLTMCRSLLGNPLVILVDEPTEGLAPKIVSNVEAVIRDIHRKGVSVVLVEQKLTIALKVSDRVCVMGHGQIVFNGTPEQLKADEQLLKDWLSV